MEGKPIIDENITPSRAKRDEETFYKNQDYEEVIWKAVSMLETPLPTIPFFILWGTVKEYSDPCSIYLYQTVIEDIRKFGISIQPLIRPNPTAEGNLYKQFLKHFPCDSRKQASVFEFCLKHLSNAKDLEKYQEQIIENNMQRHRELSTLSKLEFSELIPKWLKDYRKMSIFEFCKIYLPELYKNHHQYADAVLKERMVISGGTDLSNHDEDVVRIKPHIGSPTDFEKIYYTLRKTKKPIKLDL